MLDLKIVNGTIVDGTGAPGYRGDVGVKGGRIVAVGQVSEPARETIDATGKVVAPGFVDIHTHYDAQVFWDPTLSPSCFHGVTTVIGGNCGFSIAPLSPEAGDYLARMLARVEGMPLKTLKDGVPWDWRTFAEFLGKMENTIAVNAGFMAGHSAIRRVVMGERAVGQKSTPEELDRMKAMLDQALGEGALGFSTTVSISHNDAEGNPVPSRHASDEEILELAKVVSKHEGTTLELLPNTNFDDDMIELMAQFSLAGQRPVNWNVMAVTGADEESQARIQHQLSVSDYARKKGAEVLALTLPVSPTLRINLAGGFIFDAVAGWAPLFRLPIRERIERLKDPFVRAVLENAAASDRTPMGRFAKWGSFVIAEVQSPKNKPYEGKTVGEVAKQLGKRPFDTAIDIALEDELKTSFMPPIGGNDAESFKLRGKLWKDDRVIVGASDAGAHMDMIDTFALSTNFLAAARDHHLLTIEEAVQALTQRPATVVGLKERGQLKEGWHADITVFDQNKVACGPVYTRYDLPGTKAEGRLYADAVGVEYVIVNGMPIVHNGKMTEARPGTVLRSGQDTYTVSIKAAQH